MRRLSYWIGTTMLAVGLAILLVAGGLYAYDLYSDAQEAEGSATETPLAVIEPPPTATPTIAPTETPVPAPSATPSAAPVATGSPLPLDTATATPTITSTPSPTPQSNSPRPATRIRASSIKLDTPVTESAIKNGQWVVPRFAAGHLQGTAQPGGPGNAVYAGHVSSRSAGDVFANIGKLASGDEIVLATKTGDLRYKVTERRVVKNNDLSVTKDVGDERITLITCTGTWQPLQRDYTHRLIVVAQRVG